MTTKIDRFYIEDDVKTSEIYDRCYGGCYNYSIIRVNTDSAKFNKELAKLLLPVINDYYNGELNIEEGAIEKIKREIQSFINFWRK